MACNCAYRKRLKEKAKARFNPKRTVYLDYNATTPVDPAVLGAFDRVCRSRWGNPSSMHSAGMESLDFLETQKKSILDYYKPQSGELYFCSSGSEALHGALAGLLAGGKRPVFSTKLEHASVKIPLRQLSRRGYPVFFLPVDPDGIIDTAAFEARLKKHPRGVLIYSPVNHETGGIQPVETLYKLAASYDTLVVLDGVQSALRLAPALWAPFCDLFAFSGHKLYAPKGTGALFVRENIKLKRHRFGGLQMDGIFPGTENTPGIASLTRAVELAAREFGNEQQRLSRLSEEALALLTQTGVDYMLESPPRRIPGVLCLSLPWAGNMEDLLFNLNENHICISRFSACTPRVRGPSAVLTAMGREKKRAERSLRISFGRFSKREDFYLLAKVLKECAHRGI